MNPLAPWGWDDGWAALFGELESGGEPARVVAQERARWAVRTGSGERPARIVSSTAVDDLPVVGDWVVVEPGPAPTDPLTVLHCLPRRSAFVRGASGDGRRGQALAANVDHVWVVHGLDAPVNARRLERYLALAWESGASPSVVLTKADLCDDPAAVEAEVRAVAMGVRVHVVSAGDASSVDRLREHAEPGKTVVLLGPSGAGKSTLVNLLSGAEVAPTGDVRAGDRKGRHTTTRRQLFPVAGGALVIDTPGLRELRLWNPDQGLERAYPEIEELARGCRFADCRHDVEPGCSVLAAVEAGELARDRLDGFRKLQAEAEALRRRTDPQARKEAVSEHKTALKTLDRYHPKRRDRG